MQYIKLFLDCCHQFCKATHDDIITPFWLSKSNYVTLLNLQEQIERFGLLWDYWVGSWEHYIQLIKQKLVNMCWAQSFMLGKLTEIHQSNMLGLIMHNKNHPVAGFKMPCNGWFHTYASRVSIIDHLMSGKIISSVIITHSIPNI